MDPGGPYVVAGGGGVAAAAAAATVAGGSPVGGQTTMTRFLARPRLHQREMEPEFAILGSREPTFSAEEEVVSGLPLSAVAPPAALHRGLSNPFEVGGMISREELEKATSQLLSFPSVDADIRGSMPCPLRVSEVPWSVSSSHANMVPPLGAGAACCS